jgi:hypothetical protein
MKLRELAVACYIYSIIADDKSYLKFRATIKNSTNLFEEEHRKALLEFLNGFGCRHINRDSHKMASKEIRSWYNKYGEELPQEIERLWELKNEKLKSFDELHSTLSELVVACRIDGVEVRMGPVGAAKMLFAIRPHVFPPWDNVIRKKLKMRSYGDYLKHVREVILDLKKSCKNHKINIDDLPEELGRPNSTVVKLIDEYYWITITNEFDLEEIVKRWKEWA